MHVKGHLRQTFLGTLDSHRAGSPPVALNSVLDGFHDGRNLTWGRLLGLLWNCTDVMPGSYCTGLDLEPGSSFARGVRKIRASY